VDAPEPDRRRYDQAPARPGALGLGGLLGLLDIGQDLPGALQIARTDIRQHDRPRGPLQKPDADVIFQSGNQSGDA
jgi:hypothetical protein